MDVCALPGHAAEDLEPGWVTARAELTRIRDLVAPQPVVVLAIPDEFQVNDALRDEVLARITASGRAREGFDLELPQRRLAALCAELGVALVDPLPELRRRTADGEVLYLTDDSHWNAAGNQLGARLLSGAPALQELGS